MLQNKGQMASSSWLYLRKVLLCGPLFLYFSNQIGLVPQTNLRLSDLLMFAPGKLLSLCTTIASGILTTLEVITQ